MARRIRLSGRFRCANRHRPDRNRSGNGIWDLQPLRRPDPSPGYGGGNLRQYLEEPRAISQPARRKGLGYQLFADRRFHRTDTPGRWQLGLAWSVNVICPFGYRKHSSQSKGDVLIMETGMIAKKLRAEFAKNLRVQLEH